MQYWLYRKNTFHSSDICGGGYSSTFDTVQVIGHACNDEDKLKSYLDSDYSFIECDVVFTKDDIPITSHDSRKSIENVAIDLTKLTYDEILDCGYIPQRLDVLLKKCKAEDVCVYLDVKNTKTISLTQLRKLYNLVSEMEMTHSVVFGSLYGVQQYLLAYVVQDKTLIFDTRASVLWAVKLQDISSLVIIPISYTVTTPEKEQEQIQVAEKYGVKTYPWTVKEVEIAKRYLDYGASWIMSNNLTNEDILSESRD